LAAGFAWDGGGAFIRSYPFSGGQRYGRLPAAAGHKLSAVFAFVGLGQDSLGAKGTGFAIGHLNICFSPPDLIHYWLIGVQFKG